MQVFEWKETFSNKNFYNIDHRDKKEKNIFKAKNEFCFKPQNRVTVNQRLIGPLCNAFLVFNGTRSWVKVVILNVILILGEEKQNYVQK